MSNANKPIKVLRTALKRLDDRGATKTWGAFNPVTGQYQAGGGPQDQVTNRL